MKSAILGMLAETSIHPGTGRSLGVIDLPVAREAATDYPVIVGSSLKGALKDKAEAKGINDTNRIFGGPDRAGEWLVSDARLLLLPVRSLTGAYRWVTCPHLIERYLRDAQRAGISTELEKTPELKPGEGKRPVLASGSGSLMLEERQFEIQRNANLNNIVNEIQKIIPHEETCKRLGNQLAIVSDDDFAWFGRYGLCVQARNRLEDETKKSKNLWYEETLPPDTLMYAMIMARNDDALSPLGGLFDEGDCYLQAGGNETVGQGWFAIKVIRNDSAKNQESKTEGEP